MRSTHLGQVLPKTWCLDSQPFWSCHRGGKSPPEPGTVEELNHLFPLPGPLLMLPILGVTTSLGYLFPAAMFHISPTRPLS